MDDVQCISIYDDRYLGLETEAISIVYVDTSIAAEWEMVLILFSGFKDEFICVISIILTCRGYNRVF